MSGHQHPQPPPQRGWSWSQILDTGSQTLNLATAATSAGFSTAKFFTSTGIEIAKVATQYSLALPAYAYDLASATTTADGDGGPAAARSVHALVGSVFDGVSMLALGAVDLSGHITSAALGAASTGLTSISSAISSELARSLASFARLVQRNWNHVDDSLPPGGLPAYSIIQITRALTAWVSIQLVTRPQHEQRILAGLQELDVAQLEKDVKQLRLVDQQQRQREEQQAHATGGPNGAPADDRPRITSESRIGTDGGDVITAEIGHSHAGTSASAAPALTVGTDATQPINDSKPLTPAQTMLAFDRYSRLVLGIYGGVALRYMGVDVPHPALVPQPPSNDESTGAGVVPPPEAGGAPQEDHDTELKHDEADFLAAAATLDLSQTYAEAEASGLFPGGWKAHEDGSDRIKFVLDPEDVYGSTAVERDHATPGYTTPPSVSASASTSAAQQASAASVGGTGPGVATTATSPVEATPSFNVLEHDQRPPMAYSLIDLISGKHDDDVFHQLAGVQRGHAEAGVYSSTAYRSHGRPVPSRPKFYVVTDHAAHKVVLVLRGTLSFGDVAADLTCDSVLYENMDVRRAAPPRATAAEGSGPAQEEAPDAPASQGQYHDDDGAYVVHEGIYHTALSIGGSREAPVHRAVSRALEQNPSYDLDITGHSLGAGLAALLALLWVGMPEKAQHSGAVQGRTSEASGLPAGRKLHAYCFGVPCVMSAPLGRRCAPFISSWTHSWDIVSRFSLGHVLDIRNALAWMAYEERVTQAEAATAAASSERARERAARREERRREKKERRRERRGKKAARRTRRGAGYAEHQRQKDAEAAAAAAAAAAAVVESATAGAAVKSEKNMEDVDRAASAVAADAAAALADLGEPVSAAAATEDPEDEEMDDDDEDDDEEDEEEEEEPAAEERPRPSGPPFDMTSLIKQAFAHIASTPRQAGPSTEPASSSSPNSTGPPPAFAGYGPTAAQSAYEYAASFLNRATQAARSASSSPESEAARRQTEQVFWGLRRTLEANMRHVELYPPGDVLITFEDGDLLRPAYPFPPSTSSSEPAAPAPSGSAAAAAAVAARRRLFVLKDEGERGMGKRQDVFGQIEFRTGFLARHLPDKYHATLKAVLDP
ncbi:hypothetical protein OC842_001256 [Tilletia horrida]|uniref:sn-1-specific diacylglycerol lipase n=1 Tax=Tilletia horrida TaxID=155126 RepID=A0AAN6GI77_9BASI|nr:hypothetical protein OC842_001256 [Tilletia horrida]